VFPKPARIHVRFGPPLRFDRERSGSGREAINAFARDMAVAIRRLEPLA
jgi:hypothetical protein